MRVLRVLALAAVLLILATGPAVAQRPSFGFLFYNGDTVRTVVPPAANPQPGRDNLYQVSNGVEDQLGIAAVAPGDPGYHGGHWAVNSVTFNVAPYLLTSEDEVLQAQQAGDVTVTRMPGDDFRCPIQP